MTTLTHQPIWTTDTSRTLKIECSCGNWSFETEGVRIGDDDHLRRWFTDAHTRHVKRESVMP